MVKETEVKDYLEEVAIRYPHIVAPRLDIGSRIKKSFGLVYIIDDVSLDKRLGNFPDGAVPYGPINRALKSSPSDINFLFRDQKEIPYSRVFESGFGECLEKSILVQMATQRLRPSFLINGSIELEGEVGAGAHAYNIVLKDNKPFLVDTQNPLAEDAQGIITHPYIAPILGIEEGFGDFVVPDEWKQGRTYSLS